MIRYKGYVIWYNQLQGWAVQQGYEILTNCKTLGAAKAWVTREVKKEDALHELQH